MTTTHRGIQPSPSWSMGAISVRIIGVIFLVINVAILNRQIVERYSSMFAHHRNTATINALNAVQDPKSIPSASDLYASSEFYSPKLEFVHIPKTGGSAIEFVGAKSNITWGLCHWQERPLAGRGCTVRDWAFNKPAINSLLYNKDGWEPWHTPPFWFKNNSPYKGKDLFSVVRNPYTRFISEYYCPYSWFNNVQRGFGDPMAPERKRRNATASAKIRPAKPETPETLNKFLQDRLGGFNKLRSHYLPQADFIYDEEGNQVVRHVLKFENLSAEFAELMAKYRLLVYLNTTVNARNSSKKKLGIEDLYPETIRLINRVAEKDFRLLGYEMLQPDAVGEKSESAREGSNMQESTVGRADSEADQEKLASQAGSVNLAMYSEHRLTNGTGEAATEKAYAWLRKRESELQSPVQRIYYINLEKNVKRRELMEGWLRNQTIPFQRVNATIGDNNPEACVKYDVAKFCPGVSGLAKTELDIIRNYNTTGLTLVFEDDYVVTEPLDDVVQKTLAIVPADWDVIRWNCWGYVPSTFQYIIRNPHQKVFRTAHKRPCNQTNETCWFCGGTHAMLWRDSSLQKLETIWSEQPFDDIDSRLTTERLNSYCVNIGNIGKLAAPQEEKTDIAKWKNVVNNR